MIRRSPRCIGAISLFVLATACLTTVPSSSSVFADEIYDFYDSGSGAILATLDFTGPPPYSDISQIVSFSLTAAGRQKLDTPTAYSLPGNTLRLVDGPLYQYGTFSLMSAPGTLTQLQSTTLSPAILFTSFYNAGGGPLWGLFYTPRPINPAFGIWFRAGEPISAVPEPSAIVIMASAFPCIGVLAGRRRRRKMLFWGHDPRTTADHVIRGSTRPLIVLPANQ